MFYSNNHFTSVKGSICLIACTHLVCICTLFSQASYVRRISSPNLSLVGLKAFDVNNQRLGTAAFNFANVSFTSFDDQGNISSSFAITAPEPPQGPHNLGPVFNYRYIGDQHFIVYRTGDASSANLFTGLIGFDETSSSFWTKKLSQNIIFYSKLAVNNTNELLCFTQNWDNATDDEAGFGLALLQAEDGVEIWNRRFQNGSPHPFTPLENIAAPNGNFYVLGQTLDTDDELVYTCFSFDGNGDIERAIEFPSALPTSTLIMDHRQPGIQGSMTIDNDGNIYLAGHVLVSNDINNFGEAGIYRAIIIKLNSKLELQWSKQLLTPAFSTTNLNIVANPQGSILFTIATQGSFPIIGGLLNTDGQLIEHRGYNFISPFVKGVADGSFYFLSPSTAFPDAILAKTLPDGSIPSCPQFSACVEVEDFAFSTNAINSWVSSPLPSLESFPAIITPTTYTITDYCESTPYPTPHFSFPDTLCQNACATPTDLNNTAANLATWHLSGPALDTLIIDTTFNWCFAESGEYQIKQIIWVLGCSDTAQHSLTVLADNLTPPLGNDTLACAFPFELSATSNRLLTNYSWSTGANTSSINIPQAGTYILSASDGYCHITDTIAVAAFAEQYPSPIWEIPADTVHCIESWPYFLRPSSAYTNQFFLDEEAFEDSVAIYETGPFLLHLELSGCQFTETFRLEERVCTPQIYLPNAFSPNGDGINDRIFPQGINFSTLQLCVYDRWGGLLYEQSGPNVSWDGTHNGKAANTGTYLVVLRYQDELNGETASLQQEVYLLR